MYGTAPYAASIQDKCHVLNYFLALPIKCDRFFVMNYFPASIPVLIFIIFAVPISIIDIRSRRIPDYLSIPCFILIFFVRLLFTLQRLPVCLAAALFGVLLFCCVRAATKGLGLGDVKFAAVIGLFCGFPGLLSAFLIAALLGIIAAVPLSLRNGGHSRPLPFAPFLSAGAIAAYGIWEYQGLFLTRLL
jgi:prepilin signal peptidase PulO-like enzyme (type II secretory pathway)